MAEFYFYRADDALTAALREHHRKLKEHYDEVVAPFKAAHPDNDPIIRNPFGTIIGFRDGKPSDPPPTGLSRAQRRDHLIPVKQAAGDPWREAMKDLTPPSNAQRILETFGIREQIAAKDGRSYLCWPNFLDLTTGEVDDGVVIYMSVEMDKVPDCLTPMRRSEFYALEEKHNDRRASRVPR
jgi:hypothetical protein